jgi:hypothetical protein
MGGQNMGAFPINQYSGNFPPMMNPFGQQQMPGNFGQGQGFNSQIMPKTAN